MGRMLVMAGLVIAGIGALIMLGVPLGRLPGDIAIKRGNVAVYVPITSSILVSLILSAIALLLRR